MVRRPKCKLCGHEHYSHEPHEFDGAKPKRTDNPLADKPSIGRRHSHAEVKTDAKPRPLTPVNKPPVNKLLTRPMDDQPMARAAAMAQAIERINELEDEIKVLKRALADAHAKLAGRAVDGELPKQNPARADMASYMRERRARIKADRAAKAKQ
jgi:hypothetical protein